MSLAKKLSAPLRAYFNPRFDSIADRLTEIEHRLDVVTGQAGAQDSTLQLEYQSRIDVTGLNARYEPQEFGSDRSIAARAAHFADPAFRRWFDLVHDGGMEHHRKPWEYAFVLDRAERAGVLRTGARAVGFGVGTEPVPAVLASHGVDILATDLAPEDAGHWAESNQHADGVASLSFPAIVDDATLSERVRFAAADMNDPVDGLGRFDLVWSSCAIEHLGSPEAGLDFVLRSAELLEPGAIALHTTELELTARTTTADHGHCAVYRPADFEALAEQLRARGFLIDLNLNVAMESPLDRYVALPPYPASDPAHLKLAIFDSVSTSFGIAVRKPAVTA